MNVDQKLYEEQAITDDSDNVTKNCDQEITKAREILEQPESMMKESSKESELSTTRRNYTPRRVHVSIRKVLEAWLQELRS